MISVEAIAMMWDWNSTSWLWWFVMSGGMLVFWGFIAWVIVQIVRKDRDTPATSTSDKAA
jgi:hypothetical protein